MCMVVLFTISLNETRISKKARSSQHFPSRSDRSLVEQLFLAGWLHPNKPTPKVVSIFRLLSPSKSIGEYAAYRFDLYIIFL